MRKVAKASTFSLVLENIYLQSISHKAISAVLY